MKIVFIHQGTSWYLPYALYQAKSSSPDSEIVLLGQRSSFKDISGVIFEELQGSRQEIDFRKAYIHLSTNSESFELICYLRWFYLLRYMQLSNTDKVFCFDSDVLLYSPIAEIMDCYDLENMDCGYLLFGEEPGYFAATGCMSFWTRGALEKFCNFMVEAYCQERHLKKLKDFWREHSSAGRPGGVCDMTVLYMFWQENQVRVANLIVDQRRNIFDPNINEVGDSRLGEFEVVNGWKKVKIIDQKPIFFRIRPSKEMVRAHVLHFQGEAKGHMALFYTGKYFEGKPASDVIAFFYRLRKNVRDTLRNWGITGFIKRTLRWKRTVKA